MHSNIVSKSIAFAMIIAIALAIPLLNPVSALPPTPWTPSDFELYGPHLDQIFYTYEIDPAGTFNSLIAHDADMGDWDLDATYVNLMSPDSTLVLNDTGGAFGMFVLDMLQNQTKPVLSGVSEDDYVATGDPTVISILLHPGDTTPTSTTRGAAMRHAIAHLIDRPYIINTILGGFGTPTYTYMPAPMGLDPGVDLHDDVPGPDYATANFILDQAGFVDTGDAGTMRNKPGGTLPGGIPIGTEDVVLDILFRAGPRGTFAVNSLLPALATVGLTTSPLGPVGFPVAYDHVFTNRRQEMYTGGWSGVNTQDSYPWLNGRVGWEAPPAFPNNYMLYPGWRDTNNDGWTEPDPDLESYTTPWTPASTFGDMTGGYYKTILSSPIATDVDAAFAASQVENQKAENVYNIGLWSSSTSRVYSTHDEHGPTHLWKNIRNQRGLGVNTIWSLFNGYVDAHPDDGTMRYALSTDDAVSFNAIYSSSYFDANILGTTQDSLLTINPNDVTALGPPSIMPYIAESFEFTQENDAQQGGALVTTLKFTLRGDVYFHDGVQVTADDVEFTLEAVAPTVMANGAPAPWWFSNVQDVNRVDVIDPLTVKVWMKGLSVFYLRNIGFMIIMPKHIWNDPASDAYIGIKGGESQANYIARIMGFAPDKYLIGPGMMKVYPNVVRNPVGAEINVYTPTVSAYVDAFKPELGSAAGPNENMIDPITGEYIGYFRFSPLQVTDPVQNLDHNNAVQEYIILQNNAMTPRTVNVQVILVGTGPIRNIVGITVPAATGGGAVSGKYFIDKTTLGVAAGTINVVVTPAAGITVAASGGFASAVTIAGDVTTSGNTPSDRVNVFDAILLSTSWGGAPGASTSALITGPWKTPSGDFNDDNTHNAADGAQLSLNYGQ